MKKQKKNTKNIEPEKEPEASVAEEEIDAGDVAEAEETEVAESKDGSFGRDRFVRLQADFDNFRKRTQKERGTWYRQANEDLLQELLPALDHFELGIKTAIEHDADAAVVDGFKLVHGQLMGALNKFGLEPIDAEGASFDPHLHEAVTHLPSEEHPEDTVMVQTRRGYKLGDKLLRPAQVVVSSGPKEGAATVEEADDEAGEES